MKKIFFLSFVALIVVAAPSSLSRTRRQVVKIQFRSVDQATFNDFLKSSPDILHRNHITETYDVLCTDEQLRKYEKLGLITETILPDADAYAKKLRDSDYLSHFHTYDEMIQEMQDAVAAHPNIAELIDFGDSYEKTIGQGGYDMWVIKISDNVEQEEDEPGVLLMANIHAREIITPEVILNCMHFLIDNYGTDPYVTHLVNNRQIWLMPSINPDGHEYVFSGTNLNDSADPIWWRKNKRDNNENGFFDGSDGVDLNRNWGHMWGYNDLGSSPYIWAETYRGPEPFSEPETQAVRDFILSHNIITNLSFHSYGQMWLYPWGYKPLPTPDHAKFVAMGDSCTFYNGYTPGSYYTGLIYETNGDTDDWMYGEQELKNKIFSFSPEVGSAFEGHSLARGHGFHPDISFIKKQIDENLGPQLYMIYVAGEEPIIDTQPLPDNENSSGSYTVMAKISPSIVLTQPVELDTSSVKVFYNLTGEVPFNSVSMLPAGTPDYYYVNIPGPNQDTSLYYYIEATDLAGRTGHFPRGAPMGLLSFKVGADRSPPTIIHESLANQSRLSPYFRFTAEVTDNLGIDRVQLIYRRNATLFDTLDMNLTYNEDVYEVKIRSDTFQVGDVFEYFIEALDVSVHQNKTRSPEAGFYRFTILNSIVYDFEQNSNGFSASAGGDWQWGTPTVGPLTAFSGVRLWGTQLRGNYSNCSNSMLDLPAIDLTDIDHCQVTFWHWYSMEFSGDVLWDGGNVKISVDGSPFEVIEPVGGYDQIIDYYNRIIGNEAGFGGPEDTGNFWHQERIDLSIYKDKTATLRFHFGSDDNTTSFGWYIDDVEILLLQNKSPIIMETTRLANTSDVTGPYWVTSTIIDGSSIASASLFFSVDSAKTFSEISMKSINENHYQGEIPGQPYGTFVNYYIKAGDQSSNITTDPSSAPFRTYSFLVTDRLPQLEVVFDNRNITILNGETYKDSLLLRNLGLIDLVYSIEDSFESTAREVELLNTNRSESFDHKIGFEKGFSRLEFKPSKGIIRGEASHWITLIIDSTALDLGDYQTNVLINSNDPISPVFTIPLSIHVVGTVVDEETIKGQSLPSEYALGQNYPNPFNSETNISYQLPKSGMLVLKIYNVLGQEIRALSDSPQVAGFHSVIWDGRDECGKQSTSGIYIYILKSGHFTQTRKMLLIQ